LSRRKRENQKIQQSRL